MDPKDPKTNKYLLNDSEMPTRWYNIVADLPKPPEPVLHPATGQPIGPADLAPIFPMEVIKQEVSAERYITIPEEVQEIYRLYRPSPLIRARRQEGTDTPARIYYKYEEYPGRLPPSRTRPSPGLLQQAREGVRRIATETGAGQWGSALSMACAFFGLECKVYMVKVSYLQKPYRRILMETYGASVVASPSTDTAAGRQILAGDPDSPGSLGIAISEAVEDAATRDDTKYSLGSVLNHVLLHQTIVGEEALLQFVKANDYPDVVIGCVGGGSNYAGLAFPFLREHLTKRKPTRFVAVEPKACPSLTKGVYAYDFGDTAKLTPMMKMYTLGHDFVPAPIHAGGLRYHGMAPLMSALYDQGLIEAVAVPQRSTFAAAVQFARTEGVLPAPESAHAIRVAIDEALRCKAEGKAQTIVFNLSGHGHFDLASYEKFLTGQMEDYEYPADKIAESMACLPKLG